MAVEDGRRIVRRFWDDVFNEGNVEAIDEIVAPGFVLHDLAVKKDRNRVQLSSLIQQIRHGIPDTRAIVEDQLADGDRIVTRLTLRTPRRTDQTGSTETSTEEWVDLSAISISRVSERQIQETWFLWESLRAEREIEPNETTWRWPPWR